MMIRALTSADAAAAAAVVQRSFLAGVAPDWTREAVETFLGESSAETLTAKLREVALATGAFDGPDLHGVLLMQRPGMLGMLFVHPASRRQGIGRALWEHARRHVEAQHPDTRTVEVNAAPGAVAFYRAHGFAPLSTMFEREGARAMRMACWLPARALRAEP